MKKEIIYYRYEKKIGLEPESNEIILVEYKVIRQTPKGYWIKKTSENSKEVWVFKNADESFAYTSKKEAFTSFVNRTQKSKNKAVKAVDEEMTFLKLIRSFDVSKLYE